jgi:hypothetical protein
MSDWMTIRVVLSHAVGRAPRPTARTDPARPRRPQPSRTSPRPSTPRSGAGTSPRSTSSRSMAACCSPTARPGRRGQRRGHDRRGGAAPGHRFTYVFDLGEGWDARLLVVEEVGVDPFDDRGRSTARSPTAPVPVFGWGTIPDQYGRLDDEEDDDGDLDDDEDERVTDGDDADDEGDDDLDLDDDDETTRTVTTSSDEESPPGTIVAGAGRRAPAPRTATPWARPRACACAGDDVGDRSRRRPVLWAAADSTPRRRPPTTRSCGSASRPASSTRRATCRSTGRRPRPGGRWSRPTGRAR